MFELRIFLRDRLVGRSTFSREEVRIGRSADNEVQIDNPGLSRYHASIESVAGIYLLKDFGSQNGTFVNGERVVGRTGLSDGDRITMGKFTLAFGTDRRPTVSAPEVRDQASYAVAGKTLVLNAPSHERPCPWVGYLEEQASETVPPPRHAIDRDLFLIGSGSESNLDLGAKRNQRLALIARTWKGFHVVVLEPGSVEHRGRSVDLQVRLRDGDPLAFGGKAFTFHVGYPDA